MKWIEYYKTQNGKEPCREWLNSLNLDIQQKVLAYVVRAAQGAAKKNIRALGNGVFEIKVNCGPGLRVYFSEAGNFLILLLAGGDKSTQFRDIRQAKDYWRDHVSK